MWKIGLPVLDGDDAAGREAAAVARAVDVVDDSRLRVAAQQEIGVERVDWSSPTVWCAAISACAITCPP